ncbi:DUF6796 family protein [Legionella genomosp. 1]|uniref:DUF6796 family protein n=1 Tax=Legionella genomosp. 1 TaxID=1093625 RepID=UPI0010558B30|nr:DUF6796 family protein [Legionella genomosp. 1]
MSIDKIILAGFIGLAAAVLVGTGEFLLHYTSSGYDSKIPYQFFHDISRKRLLWGHFIAVLAAPFYLVGFWHLYQMLLPAGGKLPAAVALTAAYGFIMGIVWIGSRAIIAAIIQSKTSANAELIASYQLYEETLLQIIRVTTLAMSAGFVYLVLTGSTYYPSWMWALNPFFILLAVFLIYFISPAIGKYIMPIAMNVTYTLFFALSTFFAIRLRG